MGVHLPKIFPTIIGPRFMTCAINHQALERPLQRISIFKCTGVFDGYEIEHIHLPYNLHIGEMLELIFSLQMYTLFLLWNQVFQQFYTESIFHEEIHLLPMTIGAVDFAVGIEDVGVAVLDGGQVAGAALQLGVFALKAEAGGVVIEGAGDLK